MIARQAGETIKTESRASSVAAFIVTVKMKELAHRVFYPAKSRNASITTSSPRQTLDRVIFEKRSRAHIQCLDSDQIANPVGF